jgi:type III secretion system FlhB-like substrate exporter
VTTRGAAVAGAAALLLVVAVSFFAATTFHGDDHLFLAYARHAPHPFVAFVSDAHGGEYYRPLPMMVWWLLGRPGLGSAPCAALAFGLHAGAAALTALLVTSVGRPVTVAGGAALLMLLAPQNQDAASWFSASTDLFATVFVLAALIGAVRGKTWVAAVAALCAFLSKESACVLPLLTLLVLRGRPWRNRLIAVAPQVALLAVVLVVRTRVLHGWGGAGDARAGLAAKLLQIAGGLAHVFTGDGVMPEVLAFGGGAAILALAAFSAFRRRRDVGSAPWLPFAFCAIATVPLLAAGWAVGARYFYLPAVGLAWAVAEALEGAGLAAHVVLTSVLMLVGGVQFVQRRADVVSYERRVAAARRVVAAGVTAGHRVFNIMSGVKDLDLAVKEDPALVREAKDVLVLTDVPASFVIVPPALAEAAAPFLAQPPLPPSGAYRFGDVRVVGLARREDGPSLREVWQHFPDIRFVRLRPVPSGQIIARDVTDETRQLLDAEGLDGREDGAQD